MTSETIIAEIEKLPLVDKLLVMERTLYSIRRKENKELEQAVDLLYDDYKNDRELTVFTQLDMEDFYKAK